VRWFAAQRLTDPVVQGPVGAQVGIKSGIEIGTAVSTQYGPLAPRRGEGMG